jgi:hypothetical protein
VWIFGYKPFAFIACLILLLTQIKSPSTKGGASFSLEFHLPYYAWRPAKAIIMDIRKRSDGTPFRRSEEVIPLQISNQVSGAQPRRLNDYIHEAQLSVMVTGVDDWVWSAYCFADVYFKGRGHSERVEHYFNPDTKLDPSSCGRFPANPPVWIPREYFLRALSARTEQVKQEWNNSVFRLIQQIEPHVRLSVPCLFHFVHTFFLPKRRPRLLYWR